MRMDITSILADDPKKEDCFGVQYEVINDDKNELKNI